MVGAVSVVGSSLVDGKACLDATMSASGGLILQRHFVGGHSFRLIGLCFFTGLLPANSLLCTRRTVLNQLYEMNPTQYRWLYNFVASNELGYGKHFIRNLGKEQHELAERVMVTRLHLYGRWIKKCDHTEMYERISDQNLELMRERLMETVIWPSDDSNTEF
ncbi:Chaperonin-like RbcX protein 2, chloroplastic [Sesamum angolense]|uniref:Chaperonin-like RbcX protein 2, chloroplastic n=1 Tax=Sesamum angolense TaxID=2727404 RepID=A0AAE1XBH1_9LAMI|nr:Chaperonin-like RbcX protein 2, chloroplastic [Sesamum angolense]